jgi:hypothetical protein
MLPSLRGQLTPREGAGRLPVFLLETWASYPTNYLPLGRNTSLVPRRRDKGKLAVRRGRKAYGPPSLEVAGLSNSVGGATMLRPQRG